jgi:very-short-patch-repair endonuclease
VDVPGESVQRVKAEQELLSLLRQRPLAVQHVYQHHEGKYIIDFFWPEWKLGAEIDGPWHESEADQFRDGNLAKIGIAVLRLPADLTAERMREQVRYVAQRILFLGMPAKVEFVRNYRPPKPELKPATWDRQNYLGHPLCLDCSGNGWRLTPIFSEKMRQAEMRATRCKCENLREDNLVLFNGLIELNRPKPAQKVILFPEKREEQPHG